ncbi:MAG TPA: FtsX-like permease family protein, partial [Vicinamibacterales bacterium]|nr:FtsX-like permease family protein [Vicinamibacterales bacterium]
FVAGTSLLATCVFSAVPALAGTRLDLHPALGARSVAAGTHRLQRVLVVSQVATSVALVGSATLLMQSYYNLTRVETGFDASGAVTFHVGARWDEDRTRVGLLQEQLIARLEELPHVEAAGMTSFLPATGATLRYQVLVDGVAGPNPDGSMNVGYRMISSGYLRAIRAPLAAGAWCAALTSRADAPLTAMVNREFVEVYAPKENLVGRSLRLLQGSGAPFRIAGIVGDLAEDGRASGGEPYVYTCNPAGAWPDPEYVARTADPAAFGADLRHIVRELDSSRAVFGLRSLEEVVDAGLDRPRLDAAMLGAFAAAAMTLAGIGLYSFFMLLVSERAREMAVRLAVGAAPRQMVALVMAGAGRLLAGGIVLGIALTAASDRVLRGVLFGVTPLDADVLAAAAVILAIVSAAAVTGPALRASRVDPIDALRAE